MPRRQELETAVVQRLKQATRFVEAAGVVCERARARGAGRCTVLLLGEDGPPVLAIDNAGELSDEHRLYVVSHDHWLEDPVFAAMRRRMSVFDHSRDERSVEIVTPLIDPRGWFGTVAYALGEPADLGLERELTMLGTMLSVWCTDHGIGVVPRDARRDLAQRQFQIARLAALGRTNGEIAETLAISTNTVKLRLKQVFERLRVHNRTELANVLRRLAALDGIADGISRQGELVVTRAPRRRGSDALPVGR